MICTCGNFVVYKPLVPGCCFTTNSLEQLTAHFIRLVVNHFFEDPAEVQWEPAEGKDEDKAEDGFGHLPPLQREPQNMFHHQER